MNHGMLSFLGGRACPPPRLAAGAQYSCIHKQPNHCRSVGSPLGSRYIRPGQLGVTTAAAAAAALSRSFSEYRSTSVSHENRAAVGKFCTSAEIGRRSFILRAARGPGRARIAYAKMACFTARLIIVVHFEEPMYSNGASVKPQQIRRSGHRRRATSSDDRFAAVA